MSSSKSNISNQSSRSNLLTLSQDSNSSQLKSHRANIYYKKFISKLGFLFRIDTQDLDALYNKIVECVDEGHGFSGTDDADIGDLIELARKLKDNHSMLRNMVEVLDRRFLRKGGNGENGQAHSPATSLTQKFTPKSIKQQKQVAFPVTPLPKRNIFDQKKYQQLSEAQNVSSQNNYDNLFNSTLLKAKQQVRKRKQQQMKHQQTVKNSEKPAGVNTSLLNSIQGSKYQGRLQKIFQQMSKIKTQLHKMQKLEQQQNPQPNSQSLSQSQSQPFPLTFSNASNPKTINSLLLPSQNKFQQDQPHQMFRQVQDGEYFLVDDRYVNANAYFNGNGNGTVSQTATSIPKLSLKELYTKMGMDPNEEIRDNMEVIRQTARESQGTIQKHNQTLQQQNRDRLQQADSKLLNTKQVNSTSQTNNSSHKTPQETYQYSINTNMNVNFNVNVNDSESDVSNNASNLTLIQKLNTIPGKTQQRITNTNTSIIDESYGNINGGDFEVRMKKKTAETMGSIETTTVKNSISNGDFEGGDRQNRLWQNKKSAFYQEIQQTHQKNEKSRQKIYNYLQKLQQSNRIKKKRVQDIETSLNQQRQFLQQITLRSNHNKNTMTNSKSLSNLVYTDNQPITPKYIPNFGDPSPSLPKQTISNILPSSVKQKTWIEQASLTSSQMQVQRGRDRMHQHMDSNINSYTNKELESYEVIQRNQTVGQLKNKQLVPALVNLVQNQEKKPQAIQNQDTLKQKSRPVLKNNSYITTPNNEHQAQPSHTLQLASKQSLNSIQDRMAQHAPSPFHTTPNTPVPSQPLIIPKMTSHSLFEQTRNVESKLELSEDRSYKFRVPGEEIEKIKDRVNSMFKKIKAIGGEEGDQNRVVREMTEESQESKKTYEKEKEVGNTRQTINTNTSPIKFQFKFPNADKKQQPNQPRKQSSFINSINELRQSNSQIPVNISPASPKGFVIEGAQKSALHRLNYLYQSSNDSKLKNSNSNSNVNNMDFHNSPTTTTKFYAMNNSRQSNFSFRGPMLGGSRQDSIKGSKVVHWGMPRYSRVDSVSSSREKKLGVQPLSIKIGQNPIINRVGVNNSISRPVLPQLQQKQAIPSQYYSQVTRNAPPLPPKIQKVQIPTQTLIPNSHNHQLKYFNNMVQRPTSTAIQYSQQKNRRSSIQSLKSIANSTHQSIKLPASPRPLQRNYSQTSLLQSYVTNYPTTYLSPRNSHNNQPQLSSNPNSNPRSSFQPQPQPQPQSQSHSQSQPQPQPQPPHPLLVSVPVPVTPKTRQTPFNVTSSNTNTMLESSRHGSRSSSKSRSRKGISVISKSKDSKSKDSIDNGKSRQMDWQWI